MKKEKSKKNKKGGTSAAYRVVYALLSGIVGLVLHIKVVGKENEPAEGGYVVCANHISASDPVSLCYAFKKNQVHFMAKKELFKIPLFSSFIRMLGAFPVDRSGNDVGAIKTAISLVGSGSNLGIFPQGHRYPGEDPRSTKVKNGAAMIAVKNKADIVPVYLWTKNKKKTLFGRVYVVIGEKIPFESLGYNEEASGEYGRISGIIFDRVCALGEEFDKTMSEKRKKSK